VSITIALFVYVFFVQKAGEPLSSTQEGVFATSDQADTVQSPSGTDTQSAEVNLAQDTPSTSALTETTGVQGTETQAPRSHYTQLSTTPVAGMTFIGTSTVRYSEKGTGTLVDVNLLTQETTTLTTNLSNIISATFNTNGSRVIFKLHDTLTTRFFVGVVAKNAEGINDLRGSFLPQDTEDAIFVGDTNIRYLLATAAGGEVHTYESSTKKDSIEGTLPFSQASLISSGKDTYILSRPSASQLGTLFRYTPEGITPLLPSARGLTAFVAPYSESLYSTGYFDRELSTTVLKGDTQSYLAQIMNTDTCTATQASVYCARPIVFETAEYPDRWYRGEERHEDFIWWLNEESNTLHPISSPVKETGQSFDILAMQGNKDVDNLLLLINKNNGTLWLYTQ